MIDKKKISETFRFPFGSRDNGIVYFIGIGGIGMSAIARFFKAKGTTVSGYDKTRTELTDQLVKESIEVHFTEDVSMVPSSPDLVVYTPAIPEDNKELIHCREKGFKVVKRSDVLEIITASSFNICIAGTHGKTTITTMVAHLLRSSGFGCNAFLGGIAVNYNTNFWSDDKNVCVVEADEYDRSFLKLHPDIAVITAMDADHLDIYGTETAMEEAFIDFAKNVQYGGMLITKFGLEHTSALQAGKSKENAITYSLQNDSAEVYASNIKLDNGGYEFDVNLPDKKIESLHLEMGGMHNVENALAAISIAASLGIDEDKIKSGISSFKGVRRRFEYLIKNDTLVFIDDYAHHPEELRAVITGAKTLFRGKRCTVIFQPHLFSRTRDLAKEFGEALDLADEVVLLPIYPARELPVEGVTSDIILASMNKKNKSVINKPDLIKWINTEYVKNINREFGAILITAGAGDIDTMVQPIMNELKEIRA